MPRRRSRHTLNLVFGVCSLLWLFGLNGGDLTALHLLGLIAGGMLALVVAGALRRRAELGRERAIRALGTLPQTSPSLRRR